jgi:hypothetical protein
LNLGSLIYFLPTKMSVSTIDAENDNDVSNLIQIMREVYLGAMTPDSSDDEMDYGPVNRSASSMSYEAEEPVNRHLYFDDDGDEISRDEWLSAQWALPLRGTAAVFRHPRVVLQYLRFVDALNEAAGESEQLNIAFTEEEAQYILEHPSMVRPPNDFWAEVNELKFRLREHLYS